jgi:5-methylcytosine-specific restriction endonuclease McrA
MNENSLKNLKPWKKGQSGNPNGNERVEWQYQEDRPLCVNCGRPARYHTKNSDGSVKYWRKYCTMCHKNQGQNQYRYRLKKKKKCEVCGFKAVHPCQLDVDHINGDHKDDRDENLMTLCANCHRLKTVMNGDHNGIEYIPNNQGIIKENKYE